MEINERNWKNKLIEYLSPPKGSNLKTPLALALKDRFLPSHLYRYRTFSNTILEKKEFVINELKNNYVWLTNPVSYNDPFDSGHYLNFNSINKAFSKFRFDEFFKLKGFDKYFPEDELKKLKKADDPFEAFKHLLYNEYQDGTLPPKKEVFSLFERIEKKQYKAIQNEASEFNQKKLLTCSFSEVSDSILMWSHYANDHKGICIEYPTYWPNVSKNTFKILLYPMIYQKELLNLTPIQIENLISGDLNNMGAILCAIFKSQDWKYEKEWRIVSLLEGTPNCNIFTLPKPSKIILGVRMEDKEKREVEKLSRDLNIPVVEAIKSTDEFKIFIPHGLNNS